MDLWQGKGQKLEGGFWLREEKRKGKN